MKIVEYNKFVDHILGRMNDNPEKLKRTVEDYLELRESKGTLWGAVDTMCQYGLFDCYYSQCLNTLKEVYGDEFDESKYITKDGQWRWRNGDAYIWTVYKSKICKTIEMMKEKRYI